MQQNKSFSFHVLLFQEAAQQEIKWVAQCVNYDLAAQGTSIDDALSSFEKIIIGQMMLDIESNKKPFEDMSETPKELKNKFNEARVLEDKSPFQIPKELLSTIGNVIVDRELRLSA